MVHQCDDLFPVAWGGPHFSVLGFHFSSCQVDIQTYEDSQKSQEFRKWKVHSSTVRAGLSVDPSFSPWTTREGTKLLGVPRNCPRVLDLIDIAYTAALRRNIKRPIKDRLFVDALIADLYVDLSQACQRKPWSDGGGLKTLTTSSIIYSFRLDLIIDSKALFKLHGFPDDLRLFSLSESSRRSLLGETWSLPCAGIAFYAFVLNSQAPWWKGS